MLSRSDILQRLRDGTSHKSSWTFRLSSPTSHVHAMERPSILRRAHLDAPRSKQRDATTEHGCRGEPTHDRREHGEHDQPELVERITLEADEIAQSETYDEESLHMRQLLKTKLIDMDLSVRALNCLKAAEVDTLGDLVSFNKNDTVAKLAPSLI